jgi:uncharacterized membrane protein YtjA (UPF0391 family)
MTSQAKEAVMFRWVMMFLAVSIVTALFGFTGLTASEVGFAKVLFFLFLVCLGVSVVAWLTSVPRRRA